MTRCAVEHVRRRWSCKDWLKLMLCGLTTITWAATMLAAQHLRLYKRANVFCILICCACFNWHTQRPGGRLVCEWIPVLADRAAKIPITRYTRLRRAERLGTSAYLMWCIWTLLVQFRGSRGSIH